MISATIAPAEIPSAGQGRPMTADTTLILFEVLESFRVVALILPQGVFTTGFYDSNISSRLTESLQRPRLMTYGRMRNLTRKHRCSSKLGLLWVHASTYVALQKEFLFLRSKTGLDFD
jgi:hypothetical protein